MSGYLCFQIELTRGYDYSAFREDLKKLYNSAGVEGKNTVFLFTDTQVDNIWYFAVFPNLYSYLKYVTVQHFILFYTRWTRYL